MSEEQELYRIIDVTDPHGTVRCIRNHYWWALNGDPKQAVFYVGQRLRMLSPQCNTDRRIVDDLGVPFANAAVIHIPLAFAPERQSV